MGFVQRSSSVVLSPKCGVSDTRENKDVHQVFKRYYLATKFRNRFLAMFGIS